MMGWAVARIRLWTGWTADALPIAWWVLAVALPFGLAWVALSAASPAGLFEAWGRLDMRHQTDGAIAFAVGEAALSMALALGLGLPAAWSLGRSRWPLHRLWRVLLTVPFVIPTIVAALAFLVLLGPGGPVARGTGIDLLGAGEGGRWLAIGLAHAWFNVALVVRFVEPLLGRLDPELEASMRLLPAGRGRVGRLRALWWPLLWPSIAAAAALTFLFSFTSFAVVRHLGGPELYTPERAMAELGGQAGLPTASGAVASEVVLALGMAQLLIMLLALGVTGWLQARARRSLPQVSETAARVRRRSLTGLASLALPLAFVLAPMLALIDASVHVGQSWSLEPWRTAWMGGRSTGGLSVAGAVRNSVTYALATLLLALPLAALVVRFVRRAEGRGRLGRAAGAALELAIASPLALSAVMVGLGVMLGVLRTWPGAFSQAWVPVLPHTLLATPFAVRLLLPAVRDLDPDHEAAGAVLGLGPLRRWWHIRLPLLRGPLLAAATFVLAISLGEFGASWVLVSSSEWMTLPVFVDQQLGRPFDLVARGTAHVGAVFLLAASLALFVLVERWRTPGEVGVL